MCECVPYLAAGFVARLLDGTLGMGYGVASSTILLGAGLPPLAAYPCKRVAPRELMAGVGAFNATLSLRTLFRSLAPYLAAVG